MIAGIILCLGSGIRRKCDIFFRSCLIVAKGAGRRISGGKKVFNCFAHNSYLHSFSTHNNDFKLFVFDLKVNCFLGNRRELVVHVNKFNLCFIDEVLNFYLDIVKCPRVKLPDLLDREGGGLFDNYVCMLDTANKRLRSFKIEIRIFPEEAAVLKNLFASLDDKLRRGLSLGTGIKGLFRLFEEIKMMPRACFMSVRYLSFLSEEIMVGPRLVVLDIFHKCNTDCIHCWIHSPAAGKALGKEFTSLSMDLDSVMRVVDDCVDLGVDTITLLADGEPILNPDFLGMLRYIKRKNHYIDVITSTNGLAVTPAMSNELVKLGLNEICFSVPAATAQTYTRICPSKKNKDFIRIRKNISYLCGLKNSLKHIYSSCGLLEPQELMGIGQRDLFFPPFCIIAFVLHNANFHEITQMAQMAIDLGVDEMRFQLIHLDKDNKYLQLNQDQVDFLNGKLEEVRMLAEKNHVVLSSALKFQLSHMHTSTGDWNRGYYLENGCPIGFFFSIIKANGDVGLCCSLKIIDNLKNRSFKDIWLSGEYHKARVGAKYLRNNKDMKFLETTYHKDEKRGDLLYSERCEYCDNHDMNNEIIHSLKQRGLFDLFMTGYKSGPAGQRQ